MTPGDMAVLVRTNVQAEAVQKALVKRGIPCCLSKTGSVFDSIQAQELYDILCAVDRPGDMGLIKAALVSSVYHADEAFLRCMNTDRHPCRYLAGPVCRLQADLGGTRLCSHDYRPVVPGGCPDLALVSIWMNEA